MKEYIDTGKNYGYTWQGAPHRIVLNSMQNGMLLAVSVPEFERHRMSTSMLQTMLFLLVIVFLFALVLVVPAIFSGSSRRPRCPRFLRTFVQAPTCSWPDGLRKP